MHIEAMIAKRDAVADKLQRSQYSYQGNIKVPSSLQRQWQSWRTSIARWNMKITDALKFSKEYKAWEELKKKAGV